MITEVFLSVSHIVETDEEQFPTFRRHSAECWENLMGESWESVYQVSKLEEEFQNYMRQNNVK